MREKFSRFVIYMKYKGLNDNRVTVECGLSQSLLHQARQGKSDLGAKTIDKILSTYQDLSRKWLVTGEGEMLVSDVSGPNSPIEMTPQKPTATSIPLVTQSAVAGFGNMDFMIKEADVKAYYVIPKFNHCKVDFMIEISGSSMYPKYNSGDVVACTILHERSFIQWNKCHIIATREQGILCKRLRPSQAEGCITAVSDNENYPPFDIPVSDITGIALVVGVIRLE